MTYSEDVNRALIAASNDTIDFLNARIEALEKRIEFLQAQNKINNKNK
jgi:tetrahydromethanopterin S-methyltransferase subunit G